MQKESLSAIKRSSRKQFPTCLPCLSWRQQRASWRTRFWHQCSGRGTPAPPRCWQSQGLHTVAARKDNSFRSSLSQLPLVLYMSRLGKHQMCSIVCQYRAVLIHCFPAHRKQQLPAQGPATHRGQSICHLWLSVTDRAVAPLWLCSRQQGREKSRYSLPVLSPVIVKIKKLV